MTGIYYRDLNDIAKADFKQWFEQNNRKDLLKAIKNDEDIEIGESFNNIKDYKVV